MRIGIIGAGGMGGILARRLAKLGHHVSIANSRGPQSLAVLAAEIGATPVSAADAAAAGQIRFHRDRDAGRRRSSASVCLRTVPGSVVVVDIGNDHRELRDGRIDAIDQGTPDSQWVAHQVRRPVIKAFNNIFAEQAFSRRAFRGERRGASLSRWPAIRRTPGRCSSSG